MALIGIIAVFFGFDAMAAPKKVAVFVEGNINAEQESMINSAVMARLSGNRDFRVFERNANFLRALQREHDYELSGEVSEDQIRAIGSRLGVDYVIAICAVITKDDKCQMSARLLNIETGETLKTCNDIRDYEDSSTLTTMANMVTYRLITRRSH